MNEFVASFVMLLPGFAATMIRDQLVPSTKRSDFERTLESLFWTFVIYLPFGLMVGRPIPIVSEHGRIDTGVLALVYATSAVVGALRAFAVRHGWGFALARRLSLTDRIPDPNIWLYAVRKNSPGWAIVHVQGGKKFYGYIDAFDDELERSEFYMERVSELDDKFDEIRDLKRGGLLVTKDQATLVEFYPEGALP